MQVLSPPPAPQPRPAARLCRCPVIIEGASRASGFSFRGRILPPVPVLYLAIPAQNEDATIGVLLWRIRTVLAEFPREYEVVVYDDGSTDETAAVAEQYVHAMPVTVLRGGKPIGYAGAVNALVRHIAGHTRYPRRDAMMLLQGDFTDPPGIVPEFARRFEGGADLVVGERTAVVDAPTPVSRLFKAAGWAMRPFVRVEGVRDMTGSMRLIRISALRDLLRTLGDAPVCEGDTWTANADLLLRLVPHARRIETVPLEPTYGVRTRDTRRVTVRDALAALRWAWGARGRRVSPSSAPETAAEAPTRSGRGGTPSAKRDEPDVTADKLRERSRERDRLRSGSDDATRREGRPERDRARSGRGDGGRNEAERDAATRAVAPSGTPATRGEARPDPSGRVPGARPVKTDRVERTERGERQPRRGRAVPTDDPEQILDDPFAAPASRRALSEPRADARAAFDPPTAATGTDAADAEKRAAELPVDSNAASRSAALSPAENATIGAERAHVPERDGDDDDDSDDAPSSAVGTQGDSDAGEELRERKRRRNRRSRRRKSKSRGSEASEPNDDANEEGTNNEHEALEHAPDARGAANDANDDADEGRNDGDRSAQRSERPSRPAREPRPSTPHTLRDASADADDIGAESIPAADREPDESDDDAGDSDDEGGRIARSRRRGRRGRRGGARRARGRGRSRDDGDDTSADQGGAGGSAGTTPSDAS